VIQRKTLAQAALTLGKSERWFYRWITANPCDAKGRPFFAKMGRTKIFSADDISRISKVIPDEPPTAPEINGQIYFVDDGRLIKIGFTRSPAARFRNMLTNCSGEPVLLHIEAGTFKTEKIFHRHFASIRVRREWFQRTDELFAFIEQRKALSS